MPTNQPPYCALCSGWFPEPGIPGCRITSTFYLLVFWRNRNLWFWDGPLCLGVDFPVSGPCRRCSSGVSNLWQWWFRKRKNWPFVYWNDRNSSNKRTALPRTRIRRACKCLCRLCDTRVCKKRKWGNLIKSLSFLFLYRQLSIHLTISTSTG